MRDGRELRVGWDGRRLVEVQADPDDGLETFAGTTGR